MEDDQSWKKKNNMLLRHLWILVGLAGLRFRGGKIQVKFVAGRHQMIAEGEYIDSESIR
jgi:hypothetical protein